MQVHKLPLLATTLWLTAATGCNSQSHDVSRETEPPSGAAPSLGATVVPAVATRPAAGTDPACEPSQLMNMQSLWSGVFRTADANGDGRATRAEVQDFSNFLVGGFMFRADQNGDGKVTPAEGREARAEFANQHPTLAALLQHVRQATGASPFHELASVLDVNTNQPITQKEARVAAQNLTRDVFRVADFDRDGAITLNEAQTAALQGADALAGQAFEAADQNDNGHLDEQEFLRPVDAAARFAFQAADQDKDGNLTKEETEAAVSAIVKRLGLVNTPYENLEEDSPREDTPAPNGNRPADPVRREPTPNQNRPGPAPQQTQPNGTLPRR